MFRDSTFSESSLSVFTEQLFIHLFSSKTARIDPTRKPATFSEIVGLGSGWCLNCAAAASLLLRLHLTITYTQCSLRYITGEVDLNIKLHKRFILYPN